MDISSSIPEPSQGRTESPNSDPQDFPKAKAPSRLFKQAWQEANRFDQSKPRVGSPISSSDEDDPTRSADDIRGQRVGSPISSSDDDDDQPTRPFLDVSGQRQKKRRRESGEEEPRSSPLALGPDKSTTESDLVVQPPEKDVRAEIVAEVDRLYGQRDLEYSDALVLSHCLPFVEKMGKTRRNGEDEYEAYRGRQLERKLREVKQEVEAAAAQVDFSDAHVHTSPVYFLYIKALGQYESVRTEIEEGGRVSAGNSRNSMEPL